MNRKGLLIQCQELLNRNGQWVLCRREAVEFVEFETKVRAYCKTHAEMHKEINEHSRKPPPPPQGAGC